MKAKLTAWVRARCWAWLMGHPDPAIDRAFCWSYIHSRPDSTVDRPHASEVLATCVPAADEIDHALWKAFRACGASTKDLVPEHDLGTKRYEVLHHAANVLGKPIRTVQDLKDLLA